MKVSKERAAENRERILDEAARLFRERGVQGIGVNALGEAAGLTYGSLYSQFGSKDTLLTEAVERAFSSFAAKFGAIDDANVYINEYLSADHRKNPGSGCAVATIGPEIPRQSRAVRRTFTEAVKRSMARVARLLPERSGRVRESDALTMLATLAGAMILARAVDDPALSDRILSVCRTQLKKAV